MHPDNLYITNPELAEFNDVMRVNFETSYTESDLKAIQKILYLDSLVSFDEEIGLAIYEGIDGYVYSVDYGHCVMNPDSLIYTPKQITSEEAVALMIEMQRNIDEEAF